MMVGRFAEVCRRCLKVNEGKSKVMVLGGEGGVGVLALRRWDMFRACLRV